MDHAEYGIVDKGFVKPVKNIRNISELFNGIHMDNLQYDEKVDIGNLHPLPPTDENVGVYCAGLNYSDHARELKMAIPKRPIFFCKGYGAISGASDDIIYPGSVSLLDYEVELAVIIGRKIDENDIITNDNISQYVLGITILNDISARDVQLKSNQWFSGKCYRTFAPLGPYIQVLTGQVVEKLYDLELELQVYSKEGNSYDYKNQKGNTKNLIFKIHELINALAEKFQLQPGDIIATGTPCGVALSRPGYIKSRLAEIFGVPMSKRISAFIDSEIRNNKKFLEKRDFINARIYCKDGTIDLGEQKNRIV